MDEITQLKAMAYDVIMQIEELNRQRALHLEGLANLNRQIQEKEKETDG